MKIRSAVSRIPVTISLFGLIAAAIWLIGILVLINGYMPTTDAWTVGIICWPVLFGLGVTTYVVSRKTWLALAVVTWFIAMWSWWARIWTLDLESENTEYVLIFVLPPLAFALFQLIRRIPLRSRRGPSVTTHLPVKFVAWLRTNKRKVIWSSIVITAVATIISAFVGEWWYAPVGLIGLTFVSWPIFQLYTLFNAPKIGIDYAPGAVYHAEKPVWQGFVVFMLKDWLLFVKPEFTFRRISAVFTMPFTILVTIFWPVVYIFVFRRYSRIITRDADKKLVAIEFNFPRWDRLKGWTTLTQKSEAKAFNASTAQTVDGMWGTWVDWDPSAFGKTTGALVDIITNTRFMRYNKVMGGCVFVYKLTEAAKP